MDVVVKCPVNPARVFMRLRLGDPTVAIVTGNLIEVDCRDCRRDQDPRPARVLHRYNPVGELIETETVPAS